MAPPRAATCFLVALMFLAAPVAFAALPAAATGLSAAPLELVITPDNFVTELLPLKEWREAQGVRVDIVTTTYVQTSMAGRDLQESIKAYVAARRAADPALTYLLLAADDPIIPARLLQVANRTAGAAMPSSDRAFASDFYYAAEGTSFLGTDLGDEFPAGPRWYGIEDGSWNLTSTLHVGRIPAKSATELGGYVTRLLAWEQNPPSGLWQSRAVLGMGVASVPDASFGSRRLSDDAGVSFAGAESWIASGGLVNISLRDYPAWPAPYDPLDDALDDQRFLSEWDIGAFLMVLAGRDSGVLGGPGEAYAGDGSSAVFAPVAAPGSLDGLGNGAKLPLYVAAYGGSANFSAAGDADVERSLYAPGGGAALAVGFSGRSSLGTAPGGVVGGWTLAAAAVRELLERPGPIGAVLDAARARFLAEARTAQGTAFDLNNTSLRAAIAGLTLLGDPASVPLVGPPRTLDVTVPPQVAPNSTATITVTVRAAGAPVANASVAIVDENGDLQEVGATDSSGVANLRVATAGRGTWTVSVAAPGFARAAVNLEVDAPPNVAVIFPGENAKVAGRVNFSGAASDPDVGDAITVVELSMDGGAWVAANGTSSWSLAVDTTLLANGFHLVEARASDGTAWSAVLAVGFEVTNAKPPTPISPYGRFPVTEDTTRTFDLDLTAHFGTSGPSAALSASVSTIDRLSVSINGSNLTITPAPDFFGAATAELNVFDSYGGNTSVILGVDVLPVDDPPVLTVARDYSVEEGGTVNFDPHAFDPDGTTPSLYLLTGPPDATATGWRTPRGSAGVHNLTIAASDGRFIVTALIVVNVISHNGPPTARIIAPLRTEAGRPTLFIAQDAADPENDPITFSWDWGDGQRGKGSNDTHVFAIPGNYKVTLHLSDSRGGDAELNQTIAVEPYRAPTTETGGASAVMLLSLAVIAACAVAAGYLLFFSRGRRAPASNEADEPIRRAGSSEEE